MIIKQFLLFVAASSAIEIRYWTRAPTTNTIPPRPPPSTTTSTAIQFTTTMYRSAPPQCPRLDNAQLMRRMRDSGFYDSNFMAPDLETAAEDFPDLGSKQYMLETERYTCDQKCQVNAAQVRRLMRRKLRKSVVRPRPQQLADPRSWWAEDYWRGAAASRRTKRQQQSAPSINSSLLLLNTGRTSGVIGITTAIECDIADEQMMPANGYQLCQSCRAVRELPDNFYPRVLNEVICAGDACIKGDGRCVQRFLPFKVLQNVAGAGAYCDDWRSVSIQLRTCCDCVLHPNSPFLRYILS